MISFTIEHKFFHHKLLKLIGKKPFSEASLNEYAVNGTWLYFRRANPKKFEAFLNEDYEAAQTHEILAFVNQSSTFSKKIKREPQDMLCIYLDNHWLELVLFENEWVEKSIYETTIWDQYLLATGKVFITS